MRDALHKLIEAVEAGQAPTGLDVHRADTGHSDHIAMVLGAFDGSLDAAKALHEALLPDWSCIIENDDGHIHAAVWPHGEIGEQSSGSGPTAARAWLLAVLRAYAAEVSP